MATKTGNSNNKTASIPAKKPNSGIAYDSVRSNNGQAGVNNVKSSLPPPPNPNKGNKGGK